MTYIGEGFQPQEDMGCKFRFHCYNFAGDTLTNLDAVPDIHVWDPDGVKKVDGVSCSLESTGIYYYDMTTAFDSAGEWKVKMVGAMNSVPVSRQGTFMVDPSEDVT